MIKKILYIINILFTLLLVGSYVSALVPPDKLPYISLLTYIYPLLLIINIAFIILWLFLKWSYILIPLVAILIKVGYINQLYASHLFFSKHEVLTTNTNIKILSYNVCGFAYNAQNREEKRELEDSIFNYISSIKPEIIAFQDYFSYKDRKSIHWRIVNNLGYKYYYISEVGKKQLSGNAIYSKHPIIQSGLLFPAKKNSNSYVFADIEMDEATILRVINLHLASYKLIKQEKEIFEEFQKGNAKEALDKNFKTIVRKLIEANKKRSYEVKELQPIIEHSAERIVVLGDFNDNPFSYTYRELSKGMIDAFTEKGEGFGTTYNGSLPVQRIDYILVDKDYFKVGGFQRDKLNYSDHYPITATLYLNRAGEVNP
ncbi:MAG: endonuclease/exonuclease/phosphatase family protein [Bacteroidales bacterium]|jgi:endonuclease/exonuclease/phosphatase family metal-dependent hydrolase|nr:endonuclease/exonuclease/phosphatase family protein [Bacteroidales bacterium]